MPNIHVRFQGHELIWLKDENGSGALAPLEHIDDDGHVNMYDAFCSDSYAHISSDGSIWRYREQIGTISDLEIVSQ